MSPVWGIRIQITNSSRHGKVVVRFANSQIEMSSIAAIVDKSIIERLGDELIIPTQHKIDERGKKKIKPALKERTCHKEREREKFRC
jgi:hypothetical protein